MTRTIDYLPLSDIQPDPRNPKDHDLTTIDQSIGRFGVIDAIVVDGRTGKIVSGHGRRETLLAMQQRGEDPPEGVSVTDSGDWLVPVLTGWSSRTDAEAAAALIALNRTTELGGWVDEELLSLLDELEDHTEGVGFSDADIEDLRNRVDSFGAAGSTFLSEMGTEAGSSSFPTPELPANEYVKISFNLAPDEAAEVRTALRAMRTAGEADSDVAALMKMVRHHGA